MSEIKRPQLFLLGGYGCENAGDDAMLYALLQEFHRIDPNIDFAILSAGHDVVVPSQVSGKIKFVKLPSFKRPSLLAVLREISNSSSFIIGGGTQMFDYGRKIDRILVFLMILTLVLYSKFLRKKVYFLNIGLGPISTHWGRFLSKMVCRLADYITVREKTSYELLLGWGFTDKVSLVFDLAALMEPFPESASIPKEDAKAILGVSITPVYEIYYNDKEKDFLLVNEIAKAINAQIRRNPQLEVWLFILQGETKYYQDTGITRLLQEQLQPHQQGKLIPYNPDPREMLAQVARCSAFIGMKHHSSVFAYLSNVPQIIIDCHPKCRAFGKEIELPEEAIISLHEIANGQLGERLEHLMEHPENFQAMLEMSLARERAKVTSGIFQGKETS